MVVVGEGDVLVDLVVGVVVGEDWVFYDCVEVGFVIVIGVGIVVGVEVG